MTTSIKTTIRVEVVGAGTQSIQHEQEVEAYGKIDVTVPASGSLQVDVQPSDAGKVELLMITADAFTSDLTYTVAGGSADVPLDAPQLMLGAGAVGLLGATQNTITFSNATSSDIDVHIRVGRDATTP